jgi:predicted nucleic acid-binding protein
LNITFDTNVVLDLLLDREPFSTTAASLFSKVERGEIAGYLCATTITTVHYLACRTLGNREAQEHIGKLLSLFAIAPVNRAVLEGALRSQFADFEEAVIHEASVHAGAQALVTRNPNDFKQARIPVYLPDELLRVLALNPPPK